MVNDHVVLVGEPTAGIEEVLIQEAHDQVDGAARGAADEAAEGVAAHLERQAWGVVVVERAQSLVTHHPQPESLGDPLYREVAELLEFVLFHDS